LTALFRSPIIACMKILSAAEMREVDRLTTERYGLPSLLLMENAAMRTVEAIEQKYGSVKGKGFLILCGKGNNGGDGAAVARQLYCKEAVVTGLLIGRIDETRGDARTNFETWRAIAAEEARVFRLLEIQSAEQFWEAASAFPHDYVVDAMFGTGLSRPLDGIFAEIIEYFENYQRDATVIAIDIPSGIASDSQEIIGPALHAELTVTFTAPKIANLLPPASEYSGEIVIAPIGSPEELVNSVGSRLRFIGPKSEIVNKYLVLSRRSSSAHKGDAGKVLIIAGSRGKTGAAALAGEAAMRAGAGLVTIATAQSAQPSVAAQVIAECMSEGLAETAAGSLALEALEEALTFASERDVVAVGPGLGSSEESTRNFVRQMILRRQRPMIIDADALNSLVGWTENLQGSAELPLILTPHTGEMARLVGQSVKDVGQHRLEIAREFATAHRVILVLKGNRTLIAAPDGEVFVNSTGNAGMATGGSGDVLTGILAGLLAQRKDEALGATIAGVYLHGLAGDLAARRYGIRAMIASDISRHLGEAFIESGGDAEKP
jgi:hydroxyethylthiazole kinase-like uncharacterized protein yjeF